jgi:hypothetical protein
MLPMIRTTVFSLVDVEGDHPLSGFATLLFRRKISWQQGVEVHGKTGIPVQRGGREDRDLLGGKGANLCEMTNLGLPVTSATTAAALANVAASGT